MAEQTVSMRLTADASEFRKEMQDSAKVADQLAGTGDKLGQKLDTMFAGVLSSAGKAEDGIRELDARLDTLTGAERDVLIRASIDQAEQGIRQIDRMLSDPTLTNTEIRVLMDRRNEATRAIDDLREQLEDLGPAAREAGNEIERGLNVGALGGVAGSAGLSSSLNDAVTSAGTLRAQLGLTAEEARQFDSVAKEVYRNNFGESMGHASQVVGMVHQSLGLVDDDLSNVTQLVFSVSDAFEHVGADQQILIDGLRVMKAAWPGIDETRSLDLIAHSFQSGTGNAGDLLDTVQEYGPVFADMGFSADDMFTILNEGMLNGARNTDFLADAFKELGIRIQTEGDTGQQAIAKMFPEDEAQRLITDFSRGGEAAREAFQVIAGALVNVKDPQDQYNLAVELFGTKAEDLSTSLIPTLEGSLAGLASSTDEAGGAAESTGAQYTGFRNTLDGLVRHLETSVIGTVGDVGVGFLDMASSAGIGLFGIKALGDAFPGLGSKLSSVTGKASAAGRALGGLKAAGVIGGIAAIGIGIGKMADEAQRAATSVEALSDMSSDELVAAFENAQAGMEMMGKDGLEPFKNLAAESTTQAQRLRDALAEQGHDTTELDKILREAAGAEAELAAETADAEAAVAGMTGATQDNAAATDGMTEALQGYLDELNGMFDPIFAMQDAVRDEEEARKALTEAIEAHGPASQEAADAQDDLTRAMVDTDKAAMELQQAVINGDVSMGDFRRQLQLWVADGRMTQEAADTLAAKVEGLTGKAEDYSGAYAADLYANDHASGVIDNAAAKLAQFAGRHARATLSAVFSGWGGSTGGLVPQYRAGGGSIFEPRGTDTVPAMLTPGEYVMQRSAVDRFGVGFMDAVNNGNLSTAGSGGVTVVNQQAITIGGGADAGSIKRVVADAIAEGTRRGITAGRR